MKILTIMLVTVFLLLISAVSASTITTFNDSSTAKNFTFTTNENQTAWISLLKTYNTTNAQLNLSGYAIFGNTTYNTNADLYSNLIADDEWCYLNKSIVNGVITMLGMEFKLMDGTWMTVNYNIREYQSNSTPGNILYNVKKNVTGTDIQILNVSVNYNLNGNPAWLCWYVQLTEGDFIEAFRYYKGSSVQNQTSFNMTMRVVSLPGNWNGFGTGFYPLLLLEINNYTSSPYLDVSNDGDTDWNYTGIFNQMNNRTLNFASEITSYLSSCTPNATNYCDVPFIFHSDNVGILQVNNILITDAITPPICSSPIPLNNTYIKGSSSEYFSIYVTSSNVNGTRSKMEYKNVSDAEYTQMSIQNCTGENPLCYANVNLTDRSRFPLGAEVQYALIMYDIQNQVCFYGAEAEPAYVFIDDVSPSLTNPIPANNSYVYGYLYQNFSIVANDSSSGLKNGTIYWKYSLAPVYQSASLTNCSGVTITTCIGNGNLSIYASGDIIYYYYGVYDNVENLAYYGDISNPLILTIDRTSPLWSTPQSSIGNTGQFSYFNITWTDDASGVSAVLIETNISGIQNYTMTSSGENIYSYSVNIATAGTYYWKTYSNDSVGNWNSSDMIVFDVSTPSSNSNSGGVITQPTTTTTIKTSKNSTTTIPPINITNLAEKFKDLTGGQAVTYLLIIIILGVVSVAVVVFIWLRGIK